MCFFLQVVIKYVPYVGDSKRAMDEYTSEIMMGGTNTIALHNTCEVSVSLCFRLLMASLMQYLHQAVVSGPRRGGGGSVECQSLTANPS